MLLKALMGAAISAAIGAAVLTYRTSAQNEVAIERNTDSIKGLWEYITGNHEHAQ